MFISIIDAPYYCWLMGRLITNPNWSFSRMSSIEVASFGRSLDLFFQKFSPTTDVLQEFEGQNTSQKLPSKKN